MTYSFLLFILFTVPILVLFISDCPVIFHPPSVQAHRASTSDSNGQKNKNKKKKKKKKKGTRVKSCMLSSSLYTIPLLQAHPPS